MRCQQWMQRDAALYKARVAGAQGALVKPGNMELHTIKLRDMESCTRYSHAACGWMPLGGGGGMLCLLAAQRQCMLSRQVCIWISTTICVLPAPCLPAIVHDVQHPAQREEGSLDEEGRIHLAALLLPRVLPGKHGGVAQLELGQLEPLLGV